MTNEDYLSYARRMRAGGILLYIREDDEEGSEISAAEPLIRQLGGMVDNSLFDINPCGFGIRIKLCITAPYPAFGISEFDFQPPWENSTFRLLEDPRDGGVDPTVYRFPGKDQLEYSRESVINHRANVAQTLSKGQPIVGYLLAYGGPIPAEIKHGEIIDAKVLVVDQFDKEHPSTVKLYVDRAVDILLSDHRKPPSRRLFDDYEEEIRQSVLSANEPSVRKQIRKKKVHVPERTVAA